MGVTLLPSYLFFISSLEILIVSSTQTNKSITIANPPKPFTKTPSSHEDQQDTMLKPTTDSLLTKFPLKELLKIPNPKSLKKEHGKHKGKHVENKFKGKEQDHPTTIPLFPRSFGGYTMSLNFGTPPQTMPFVMNTASSLVWFPCTSNYTCSNCSFPNIDPKKISPFIPDRSASSKTVFCNDEQCSQVISQYVRSKCGLGAPCPSYKYIFASWTTDGILIGSTTGNLMFDTLEETVPGFLVGCSNLSAQQIFGLAGFDSEPTSLPSQLGLKKFSFCLLSHKHDESSKSTDLVFDSEADVVGLSYAPLLKTPVFAQSSHFSGYHYVKLEEIIVGDKHIKIPSQFVVPGYEGNGGTIIATGAPFTFMEKSIFNVVAQEFESQMGGHDRADDVGVLGPCFGTEGEEGNMSFPQLSFLFDGGAKMDLPWSNYLLFDDGSNAVCLSIVTNNLGDMGLNVELSGGPKIVLGNYMLKDFYMEFDLGNKRLGFKNQICK